MRNELRGTNASGGESVAAVAPAKISVVLVTDSYETIQPVVARLALQTVREAIEIVIVGPAGETLAPDRPELAGFAGVRVVEFDPIVPLAPARAAGVRAATAPVVFLGETHVYPHPGWAEALIRAHAQGWVAVASAFGNANPDGALSWANLLFDYGTWMEGRPAGEMDDVPIYNTAFKRSVLLELADLDRLLAGGNELMLRLRANGHRLYFEPAARLDHLNVSRPVSWIGERYLAGLLVADSRMHSWSRARRLLYACAWPGIALVLLSRVIEPVRHVRDREPLPGGTFPALLAGALLSALGEAVGYVVGVGSKTVPRMTEYELHKVRYTSGGSMQEDTHAPERREPTA